MGTAAKTLGQSKPAADTDTLLYTVPAATEAVISLFAANVSAVTESFRIGVVRSGNAIDWDRDALLYDVALNANSSTQLSGIALATGDKIYVRSGDGGVVFNAMGLETS